MIQTIEDFFANKLLGRLLARAGIVLAAYLSAPAAAEKLGLLGLTISVNPDQFAAGAAVLGHWAWDAFKAWRGHQNLPPLPAVD